jgi:hypothetical protein
MELSWVILREDLLNLNFEVWYQDGYLFIASMSFGEEKFRRIYLIIGTPYGVNFGLLVRSISGAAAESDQK